MNYIKEFGRPTKFYWNENEAKKEGDYFSVIIGDQDTSIKCYRTAKYVELKRFVEFIEKQKEAKK